MNIRGLLGKRTRKSKTETQSLTRSPRLEQLEDRRLLTAIYSWMYGSIQQAVDHAANMPGYDVVLIKPGTYYEDIQIQDNYGVKLKGLGYVKFVGNDNDEVIEATYSPYVALQNIVVTNGEEGFGFENVYKVELDHVKAYENSGSGLDADYVYELNVTYAAFNYNGSNGIELENVKHAYFDHVEALHNGWEGDDLLEVNGDSSESSSDGNGLYHVNGVEDESAMLGGNTVPSNGNDSSLEIYYGEFSHNRVDGIFVAGVNYITIDTTDAHYNGEDGIDIERLEAAAPAATGAFAGAAGENGYDIQDVVIYYVATDHNGDDGVEINADYIDIELLEAVYNYEEGLDVDDAYELYIDTSNFSHNYEEGAQLSYVDYIDIYNIQVNHNGYDGDYDGLLAEYVDDIYIDVAEFLHNTDDGLDIYLNSYGYAYVYYVEASYNDDDGIDVMDDSYAQADILWTSTVGNGEHGIEARYLYGLLIKDVTSTHNGKNGLDVEKVHNLEVNYSEFAHNYKDGIHLEWVDYAKIINVYSHDNYDDGLDARWSYVDIIDSLFENNGDQDIVII